MNKALYLFSASLMCLMLASSCNQQASDCVVKGTVKGVRNGTKVELINAWDHFKVVGTGVVKHGDFEIYSKTSGPAHVYLFVHNGVQLKDFLLEPGTILVEATAEDESLLGTGATGTPNNDLYFKYREHRESGQEELAFAIRDSILEEDTTGALALLYASHGLPAALTLRMLDRLEPELAAMPYVADLREEMTRRVKTEPRESESDPASLYVDMEYPDADGNPVRLSDVVNNPANRYVLLDIWATWCSPCRESIPDLREAYSKYHEKGLEIYSLSEDEREKNWKQYIQDNGMTWINVLDTECGRRNSIAWYAYALNGIPTVILIDGDTGEIIARGNQLDLDAILSELLP